MLQDITKVFCFIAIEISLNKLFCFFVIRNFIEIRQSGLYISETNLIQQMCHNQETESRQNALQCW